MEEEHEMQQHEQAEIWQLIPGFGEKYEASSLGRVRVAATGHVKCAVPDRGYHKISLYYRARFTRRVHQLVAAAFIGPCPPGLEVRHLDGDRSNNTPANLAYGTHADNIRDQVAHGTTNNGRAQKTHCLRGHAFTPENTYMHRTKRNCRKCASLREKRSQWAKRAAANVR